MGLDKVDLLAEFAVMNGYDLRDEVLVIYSYDGGVKRARMSLYDSLDKLRLKLDKDPKTIGIDLKVML